MPSSQCFASLCARPVVECALSRRRRRRSDPSVTTTDAGFIRRGVVSPRCVVDLGHPPLRPPPVCARRGFIDLDAFGECESNLERARAVDARRSSLCVSLRAYRVCGCVCVFFFVCTHVYTYIYVCACARDRCTEMGKPVVISMISTSSPPRCKYTSLVIIELRSPRVSRFIYTQIARVYRLFCLSFFLARIGRCPQTVNRDGREYSAIGRIIEMSEIRIPLARARQGCIPFIFTASKIEFAKLRSPRTYIYTYIHGVYIAR